MSADSPLCKLGKTSPSEQIQPSTQPREQSTGQTPASRNPLNSVHTQGVSGPPTGLKPHPHLSTETRVTGLAQFALL